MITLNTTFNALLKLVNVICGALICLMSLHIVVDVTSRYLFNAPISGTIEYVQYYYMLIVIFLPLPYLQFRRLHFAASVFTERAPPAVLRFLLFCGDAAAAVVCAVAGWQSLRTALSKTTVGEHIVTGHAIVLQWPGRWLVVFGFALMAVAACLGMLNILLGARVGPGPTADRVVE
jgi:TRAP-type C4-dicarboxylate transport system permease small subunit